MKIERIDHLNLTVADIDRSVEFYKRVLGMRGESMGEGRAALYVRPAEDPSRCRRSANGDERRKADAGAYLLCHRRADRRGHGPSRNLRCPIRMQGPRAGAIGTIQSVYIDDPDQNSIEISSY